MAAIAGREADEAGHADIVGIVVFDVLLAAERVDDRALQRLGELHQRRVRAGAAAAAEQRDALGVVQQRGQRVELVVRRPDDGAWRQQPGASARAPRAGAARARRRPG